MGISIFLIATTQPTNWNWAWGVASGFFLAFAAIVLVRFIPYGPGEHD